MRSLIASIGLASVTVACGSGPSGECHTPEGERTTCVIRLARGAGTLRLPPGTTVEPLGDNPGGRHFVLDDSTDVDVWVSEEPDDGLAASGGMSTDSMHRADTTFGGFPATFVTVKLTHPKDAPVYLGMFFVTLDSVRAVNVALSTTTPVSRDQALRDLAGQLTLASPQR